MTGIASMAPAMIQLLNVAGQGYIYLPTPDGKTALSYTVANDRIHLAITGKYPPPDAELIAAGKAFNVPDDAHWQRLTHGCNRIARVEWALHN